MRAKTRSSLSSPARPRPCPSPLFLFLPSFALHISYGNERKWTNKSEVERETLSPSPPEKIATRDSLSLSLFSFNQKSVDAVCRWGWGLGFPILPYVCQNVSMSSFPFPLFVDDDGDRHFGRPIDCDVTLVLARTTAALTSMTSCPIAPTDSPPTWQEGGDGMSRQIKESQISGAKGANVSVGNRKYYEVTRSNNTTRYTKRIIILTSQLNFNIRRGELINQLTSERSGVASRPHFPRRGKQAIFH